jgi:hypothetical protein
MLQRLQLEAMSIQTKALIGYVRRNPGPRLLREWATNTLHKSFTTLAMLGGGFFEIVFDKEEGRRNALACPHHFKQTEILLTPWKSNFTVGTMGGVTKLAHPA